MTVLFLVVPLSFILLITYVIGVNDFTIAINIFLSALIFFGPFAYFKNQENASIIIKNNQIINYINDGTSNFGWTEEITIIKSIEIVSNEKIKKYYANCSAKKVLLIDFGYYNIKYISMDLFTNSQIEQILRYIQNAKQ